MQLRPTKPCKWCGSKDHYQTFCRKRPQKPIKTSQKPLKRTPIKRTTSKRTKLDREFREHYLILHPPDEWGYYTCYLQTVPLCPIRLTPEQATIEHKIPKGSVKGMNLRHNEDNIGIACTFCNSDKGSIPLNKYLKLVEKRKNKDFLA